MSGLSSVLETIFTQQWSSDDDEEPAVAEPPLPSSSSMLPRTDNPLNAPKFKRMRKKAWAKNGPSDEELLAQLEAAEARLQQEPFVSEILDRVSAAQSTNASSKSTANNFSQASKPPTQKANRKGISRVSKGKSRMVFEDEVPSEVATNAPSLSSNIARPATRPVIPSKVGTKDLSTSARPVQNSVTTPTEVVTTAPLAKRTLPAQKPVAPSEPVTNASPPTKKTKPVSRPVTIGPPSTSTAVVNNDRSTRELDFSNETTTTTVQPSNQQKTPSATPANGFPADTDLFVHSKLTTRALVIPYAFKKQQELEKHVCKLVKLFNKDLKQIRSKKIRYWFLFEKPFHGCVDQPFMNAGALITRLPDDLRIGCLPDALGRCQLKNSGVTHVVLNATWSYLTEFDTKGENPEELFERALCESMDIFARNNVVRVVILTVPLDPPFWHAAGRLHKIILEVLIGYGKRGAGIGYFVHYSSVLDKANLKHGAKGVRYIMQRIFADYLGDQPPPGTGHLLS